MVAIGDDHEFVEGQRKPVARERAPGEEEGQAVGLVAPEGEVRKQGLGRGENVVRLRGAQPGLHESLPCVGEGVFQADRVLPWPVAGPVGGQEQRDARATAGLRQPLELFPG